jgi:hypothetical protein
MYDGNAVLERHKSDQDSLSPTVAERNYLASKFKNNIPSDGSRKYRVVESRAALIIADRGGLNVELHYETRPKTAVWCGVVLWESPCPVTGVEGV